MVESQCYYKSSNFSACNISDQWKNLNNQIEKSQNLSPCSVKKSRNYKYFFCGSNSRIDQEKQSISSLYCTTDPSTFQGDTCVLLFAWK